MKPDVAILTQRNLFATIRLDACIMRSSIFRRREGIGLVEISGFARMIVRGGGGEGAPPESRWRGEGIGRHCRREVAGDDSGSKRGTKR